MSTPRSVTRRGRLMDMDVDSVSSGNPTIAVTTSSSSRPPVAQLGATVVASTRKFTNSTLFVTKQQAAAIVFASPPPQRNDNNPAPVYDTGYHNPTSPVAAAYSPLRPQLSSSTTMPAIALAAAASSFRPSTPPNKRSISSSTSGDLADEEAMYASATQSPSAPELGMDNPAVAAAVAAAKHNYQYSKNRNDSRQPMASPNKRTLSASMSALPELPLRSPLNTSTGDLSSRLDRFQIDSTDANQLYTSLRSRSGVQMYDKIVINASLPLGTGDAVLAKVPPASDLIGAEKVCTLLTNAVLKPIAQPGLYYNVQMPRLLWIRGVIGVGARTAVLSVCQPVANVLVYRSVEPEHEDDAFFNDLITFALTKQPCVLVCHRIDERYQTLKEGVHVASALIKRLVSVWRSRISTDATARVWLVFCQRQSPAQYHTYLRCTTETDSCAEFPSFSSGEDAAMCARNMMNQHFEARLKNADAVARQMEAVFPVARQIVVQGHGGELFSTAKSIKAFVDSVFRLPLERCSIETLATAATNLQVLPTGQDFEQTYIQFSQKAANERKLKEQQQAY